MRCFSSIDFHKIDFRKMGADAQGPYPALTSGVSATWCSKRTAIYRNVTFWKEGEREIISENPLPWWRGPNPFPTLKIISEARGWWNFPAWHWYLGIPLPIHMEELEKVFVATIWPPKPCTSTKYLGHFSWLFSGVHHEETHHRNESPTRPKSQARRSSETLTAQRSTNRGTSKKTDPSCR